MLTSCAFYETVRTEEYKKSVPVSIRTVSEASSTTEVPDVYAIITAHPEKQEVTFHNYKVKETKVNWGNLLITGTLFGLLANNMAKHDSLRDKDSYNWLIVLGACTGLGIYYAINPGKDEQQTGQQKITKPIYDAKGLPVYLVFTAKGRKRRIYLGVFDSNNRLKINVKDYVHTQQYNFKNSDEFLYYLNTGYTEVVWR